MASTTTTATTATTATTDSTTTTSTTTIIPPHAQPSAIKMDELLVSWLGSDEVYENVLKWMEQIMTTSSSISPEANEEEAKTEPPSTTPLTSTTPSSSSSRAVEIPPFYSHSRRRPPPPPTNAKNTNAAAFPTQPPSPLGSPHNNNNNNNTTGTPNNTTMAANTTNQQPPQTPSGLPIYMPPNLMAPAWTATENKEQSQQQPSPLQQPEDELQQDDDDAIAGRSSSTRNTTTTFACPKDHCMAILQDVLLEEQQGHEDANTPQRITITGETEIPPTLFARITKEIAQFPSFFHGPLYVRILEWYNTLNQEEEEEEANVLTLDIFGKWYQQEVEPYDLHERLFRLLRQPAAPSSNDDDATNNNNNNNNSCVLRDDFLPYIKALLNEHPGLEFLSNHAEFQEKYAVTVITRIFYSVNKCHSGRITARQLRRSDLLQALWQVDEEEDINKITRYFSYEHFYVLYCRFWELDHDRDYRITREDLLKYGDHALSHMIVDRIFEAAPRPFGTTALSDQHREYLSYEDFIYFMLSEEDKANEISVRYWFQCVDVDGDGKLDNMELRSFYAVQLHRMQVMGHEMVPFEDMLCQMMDMIKPQSQEYLVTEDFLDPACQQVSGALFDALFNLNKYLMFEQRDPFVERQKREDEFETDWDRFACIDYNRLAMEEEAREDEQMEIDWVTEEDEDEEGGAGNSHHHHHHHQPGVDVAASDMSHHGFDGPVTLEAPF